MTSQVNDDLLVVEETVAEELTLWRRYKGLPDVFTGNHVCDGSVCLFHRLGDVVYVCEQTGRAHGGDEKEHSSAACCHHKQIGFMCNKTGQPAFPFSALMRP